MKNKISTLVVNNFTVLVTQKKMKSLRMKICPQKGDILVSAPYYALKRDIKMFVQSNLEWAVSQQAKVLNNIKKTKPLQTGDTIYLFDKKISIKVIHEGARISSRMIECGDGREQILVINTPNQENVDEQIRVLDNWYRKQLKIEIAKLLSKYEPKMSVSTTAFGVKKMRTRWGSCNIQHRRVWFNLDLAKKPYHCLEYVVVHELTHLLETNHTPRFWSLVERFLPTWKSSHDMLNIC